MDHFQMCKCFYKICCWYPVGKQGKMLPGSRLSTLWAIIELNSVHRRMCYQYPNWVQCLGVGMLLHAILTETHYLLFLFMHTTFAEICTCLSWAPGFAMTQISLLLGGSKLSAKSLFSPEFSPEEAEINDYFKPHIDDYHFYFTSGTISKNLALIKNWVCSWCEVIPFITENYMHSLKMH